MVEARPVQEPPFTCGLFEGQQQELPWAAHAVYHTRKPLFLRLLNGSEEPLEVPAGRCVGLLQEIEEDAIQPHQISLTPAVSLPTHLTKLYNHTAPSCHTKEEEEALWTLLA